MMLGFPKDGALNEHVRTHDARHAREQLRVTQVTKTVGRRRRVNDGDPLLHIEEGGVQIAYDAIKHGGLWAALVLVKCSHRAPPLKRDAAKLFEAVANYVGSIGDGVEERRDEDLQDVPSSLRYCGRRSEACVQMELVARVSVGARERTEVAHSP